MLSKHSETACERRLGFYAIDSSASFEELKKLALQASQDKNVYKLAQCMFEQYRKCKHAWSQFKFDSQTYTGGGTISYDRPSLAQDGTALYFIRSFKNHGELLNRLLNETSEEFFDDFYKKYPSKAIYEINSFFNLINYISNNMKELDTGFNNVAIMAFVHKISVNENNNHDNVYKKNIIAQLVASF